MHPSEEEEEEDAHDDDDDDDDDDDHHPWLWLSLVSEDECPSRPWWWYYPWSFLWPL